MEVEGVGGSSQCDGATPHPPPFSGVRLPTAADTSPMYFLVSITSEDVVPPLYIIKGAIAEAIVDNFGTHAQHAPLDVLCAYDESGCVTDEQPHTFILRSTRKWYGQVRSAMCLTHMCNGKMLRLSVTRCASSLLALAVRERHIV
eukprot:TRINITY_DN10191_c0_g1_i1.p1 TRINITY_DN10191_c0_g1~~TRINITY_DN10191_c0_g1_i1.p1  ORF type:complete len:145 (-),score=38.71 TRINITY_DN10191_c0_g1_i1:6-440(-)